MADALRGRDIRASDERVRERRTRPRRDQPKKKWADLNNREKDEILKQAAIKLGLVLED